MHRIGMFSKLGKVSIKTLRHYDETGLLKPSYVDEENGYRYYSTQQLFELNNIVALRQMGFSISEISEMLDGQNIALITEQRLKELESELYDTKQRLLRLANYVNEQKEGKTMKYQAVIKEIPACTVFSYETVLNKYSDLNFIMPELAKKVYALNPNLECVKPDYNFNLYLDGEFKETDVHIEICQAVVEKGIDGNGVVFKEMPAVTVISVLHKGAYDNLGEAYAYGMDYVEKNGYSIVNLIRESYIDGIWNKDNVEDWLTEIQIPVKKI